MAAALIKVTQALVEFGKVVANYLRGSQSVVEVGEAPPNLRVRGSQALVEVGGNPVLPMILTQSLIEIGFPYVPEVPEPEPGPGEPGYPNQILVLDLSTVRLMLPDHAPSTLPEETLPTFEPDDRLPDYDKNGRDYD